MVYNKLLLYSCFMFFFAAYAMKDKKPIKKFNDPLSDYRETSPRTKKLLASPRNDNNHNVKKCECNDTCNNVLFHLFCLPCWHAYCRCCKPHTEL